MKNFTSKIVSTVVVIFLGTVPLFAQQVKGTVTNTAGEPIVGATVVVEGSDYGEITGSAGEYQIKVANPSSDRITVSYLGMRTQTEAVNNRTTINFVLTEEVNVFEDIVVIGYGIQKKSVVTAAISSISSETIDKAAPTRIDNALRGLSSGVTVSQSSGAPGAASQVRIRGIGSINDSQPLYVVDGLTISGGIDYLNPNDIERIEVLKDAASGAVYGARAANGVILVTTRKGHEGDAVINYDFSYGMQNVWRKPSVLNATEYTVMMNEGAINNGNAPAYSDPYSYGKGTDWVGAVLNKNAPIQQHQLSVSGASEKINYMISAGYYSQEGIVGGNYNQSNYSRMTLRSNTDYTLYDRSKQRSWLSKAKVSVNASYANINAVGNVGENSEFGSVLGSALAMSPLQSIYASDADIESYKTIFIPQKDGTNLYVYPFMITDGNGKVYSMVDGAKYNELHHPLASMHLPATHYNTDKFVANVALDLQLYKGLSLRSSFGGDLAFWGNHGYSIQYYRNTKSYNLDQVSATTTYDSSGNKITTYGKSYATSAWQQMNRALLWQVENTLAYDKTIGKHSFTLLLGQSIIDSNNAQVGGAARNLQDTDPLKANISFTTGLASDGNQSVYGHYRDTPYRLLSYFGRLSYNYDERYMLQATIRRDGSSRFGPNNKWGTFPSFSAGWNIKNEEFMADVDWLSAAKFRASWGKNGNDNIGNMRYTVSMNSGNNAVFGSGGSGTETIVVGSKPNGLANPNIKWEESVQTDLGVDLGFLNNKFTLTLDYYIKKTAGMLMEMQVPSYAGDSAPIGNVGTMRNSGIEFEVGYRDNVGELSYSVTANATYNRNKLLYLGDESTSLYGDSHKIGQLTRGLVGLPFPYFYGWQTDGVFQNWDEVNSYVNSNGDLLQPKAQPGDFRFKNIDGDDDIDDDDRTMIGKGSPDWSFGFNFGLQWRGFDVNIFFQGQAGCQIFNVTRRTDLYYINLPSSILNRWTGEGSTDSAPRFSYTSDNENYRVSDYWVEDGSFLRLRNFQVGYTLPQYLTKTLAISRVRLFVSCENMLTLTKYSGCDPEVSSSGGNSGYGTTYGVDRGVYPQARTLTFGASITF